MMALILEKFKPLTQQVSRPGQPEFLNSSDSQTVCLEIFGHTKILTVVLIQNTDAFETLAALSAGAD